MAVSTVWSEPSSCKLKTGKKWLLEVAAAFPLFPLTDQYMQQL